MALSVGRGRLAQFFFGVSGIHSNDSLANDLAYGI